MAGVEGPKLYPPIGGCLPWQALTVHVQYTQVCLVGLLRSKSVCPRTAIDPPSLTANSPPPLTSLPPSPTATALLSSFPMGSTHPPGLAVGWMRGFGSLAALPGVGLRGFRECSALPASQGLWLILLRFDGGGRGVDPGGGGSLFGRVVGNHKKWEIGGIGQG